MNDRPDVPATRSAWMEYSGMPAFSPLREDAAADVCVLGAGIAGLTTAYLLAREGRSVIVLEDGVPGSGMTRMTSAHLSCAIDDRYSEVERLRGTDGARLAAESHAAAIDRIESIARTEEIECEFRRVPGYLFTPDRNPDPLEREWEAAHRAGLAGVSKLPRAPLESFDTGPCLVFPHQGQFHPLKYLAGLARAITRHGGRIFTGTHADAVEGGSPARVRAGGHAVTAGAVVVATNIPVNNRFALHLKQAAYMTYIIGARVPKGSVPLALYWDTADPYHYVRLLPGEAGEHEDLLIVGGEDHRTGQADDSRERHGRLEAWARERFPAMGRVEHRWGGQVVETMDGLAYIGRNPHDAENVYVATGDSGMGLTHGTIAGMLITDLIGGRANPWTDLYSPSRLPLKAAAMFSHEPLNSTVQYADWVTPGEHPSGGTPEAGCGAVLRRGMTKVAAYRDELGELHEFSAVCPHLKCIVQWNGAEKTWDCPCHGSRFDCLGKVINGPANADLEAV